MISADFSLFRNGSVILTVALKGIVAYLDLSNAGTITEYAAFVPGSATKSTSNVGTIALDTSISAR
jgi:hypothetical protein